MTAPAKVLVPGLSRAALLLSLLLLLLLLPAAAGAGGSGRWERTGPRLILDRIPTRFVFKGPPAGAAPSDTLRLLVRSEKGVLACLPLSLVDDGYACEDVTLVGWGRGEAVVIDPRGMEIASFPVRIWPGFLSLLPPLIAITMSLVTRQVLISLLLGVWMGGVLIEGPDLFNGTLRTLDTTIVGSIADGDHVKVLLFTLFLGGMVGVMSRSGGTHGVVRSLARKATTVRRGALAAWFMGLLVFFDDYANTIIIGPTLRPVTDRLKMSREKLAYLVDTTAAPVASIALISTWIGTELGLIGDALRDAGSSLDPYKVFLETIPYRFYPILALVFGFLVSATGRDWGPMARAEARARKGAVLRPGSEPLSDFGAEGLQPKEGVPQHAANAYVPILVVVLATLGGLWWTGAPAAGSPGLADIFSHPQPMRLLGEVFGAADSYTALLWASALGGIVSLVLARSGRILNLAEGVGSWIVGVRSMLMAVMILVLAWSLGDVCRSAGTSPYLVGHLSEHLNPHLLPVLIFLVAGAVSFATGTSWGTMAILIPVTIPLAMETCGVQGWDAGPSHRILIGSVSSILAGAVWGDHCSPVSDTTVLSSMATSCDHMDHVRTQLPYAVLVGIVGLLFGDLATAYGVSPWLSLAGGTALLWAFLRIAGRRPAAEPGTGPAGVAGGA